MKSTIARPVLDAFNKLQAVNAEIVTTTRQLTPGDQDIPHHLKYQRTRAEKKFWGECVKREYDPFDIAAILLNTPVES